jgi:hypothetical protein
MRAEGAVLHQFIGLAVVVGARIAPALAKVFEQE